MASTERMYIAQLRHPAARPLDREWRRLRSDPEALRRAATWNVVTTRLDSLDEVLAAIGYDRPPSPDGEANLRRLVELAATDALAARVVVRRLLPGALSVAARRRTRPGEPAFDDLLGALWIAIRTFDPGRNPACLAAALLSDADYLTFRRGERRRRREVPRDTFADAPAPEADTDPATELSDLVAAATRGGLADADDAALVQLLVTEPTTAHVAARLAVTERTVRNRRARVAAKLRAAASAA